MKGDVLGDHGDGDSFGTAFDRDLLHNQESAAGRPVLAAAKNFPFLTIAPPRSGVYSRSLGLHEKKNRADRCDCWVWRPPDRGRDAAFFRESAEGKAWKGKRDG